MAGEFAKVRVLDLTVDQIEQIEKAAGLPLDQWQRAPSQVALFRHIYSVATDTSPEAIGRMTLREITDAVSLDDDEDPT